MRQSSVRAFLGLGCSLLLYGCGSAPPATPEGYSGVPWESAATTGVSAQSLTPGPNSLTYEPALYAKNGYGPYEKNKSNGGSAAGDGRTLTLNGKQYAQGFGVHANSELRFSLQGQGAQCTRFTVDVGLDDEVGSKGSVIFQVLLDGAVVYGTNPMKGDSPTQTIDLNITGKKELRLIVADAWDGISYDHADWADPKIYCTDNASAVRVAFDRAALSVYHLHTASLKATFSSGDANFKGPLDLRLVPADPANDPGVGAQLQTTRVDFSGKGPTTRDLVISAPNEPDASSALQGDYTAVYRVIASAAGRDVGSAPLTINWQALKIAAHFEPQEVSARGGETKTLTLVATVDPPLAGPVALGLSPATDSDQQYGQILSIGPSTGTGGVMRASVQFRFDPGFAQWSDSPTYGFRFYTSIGSITSGYRDPVYWNTDSILTWKVDRSAP